MSTYTTIYRPFGFGSTPLPRDVTWDYVEAPWDLTTRPDLPRSRHRYGVIRTSRPLSRDELDQAQMVEAPT